MSTEAHQRRAHCAGRVTAVFAVTALCLVSGASPALAATNGGGRHGSGSLSAIIVVALILLLVGLVGGARAGYRRWSLSAD